MHDSISKVDFDIIQYLQTNFLVIKSNLGENPETKEEAEEDPDGEATKEEEELIKLLLENHDEL